MGSQQLHLSSFGDGILNPVLSCSDPHDTLGAMCDFPPSGGESAAPAQRSGPAAESSSMWDYHGTGLMLPRGTVVTTKPTDEADLSDIRDRAQLESDRRGVFAGSVEVRKVKRSVADSAALDAFCQWLDSQGLDIFGSVTWTDEHAARRGVYSLSRGLSDVERGLASASLKRGRMIGFRGRYVLTGEWHPSGRLVPHIHMALSSNGATDVEFLCYELHRFFLATCGRSRFEPMRDVSEATLYALKDTVKSSAADADSLRLRLSRRRSYGGSKS